MFYQQNLFCTTRFTATEKIKNDKKDYNIYSSHRDREYTKFLQKCYTSKSINQIYEHMRLDDLYHISYLILKKINTNSTSY